MWIEHGGRNIFVAEEFLDGADIRLFRADAVMFEAANVPHLVEEFRLATG